MAFTKEIPNCSFEPVENYIARTHDPVPSRRKKALQELCPCRVGKDFDVVWARILEMVEDPDPTVRYQALHNLADGSPRDREEQVISIIHEKLRNDLDEKVRRAARRVLESHRRTGKWNIM